MTLKSEEEMFEKGLCIINLPKDSKGLTGAEGKSGEHRRHCPADLTALKARWRRRRSNEDLNNEELLII